MLAEGVQDPGMDLLIPHHLTDERRDAKWCVYTWCGVVYTVCVPQATHAIRIVRRGSPLRVVGSFDAANKQRARARAKARA